jgi:hypothetical protein
MLFSIAKKNSCHLKKNKTNPEAINFYRAVQKIKIKAIAFRKRKFKKKKKIIQKKCIHQV